MVSGATAARAAEKAEKAEKVATRAGRPAAHRRGCICRGAGAAWVSAHPRRAEFPIEAGQGSVVDRHGCLGQQCAGRQT